MYTAVSLHAAYSSILPDAATSNTMLRYGIACWLDNRVTQLRRSLS